MNGGGAEVDEAHLPGGAADCGASCCSGCGSGGGSSCSCVHTAHCAEGTEDAGVHLSGGERQGTLPCSALYQYKRLLNCCLELLPFVSGLFFTDALHNGVGTASRTAGPREGVVERGRGGACSNR
eukprot:COSAG02_NODE_1016_length_15190_cov_128.667418_13_plen_125_part_00